MIYSVHNSGLPRQVSRGVKARIIFANPRAWIGLMFISMGLVFTIVFGSMSDMNFSNPLDTAPSNTTGIITSVNETSSRENKKDIYEFEFTYWVNAQAYNGVSYFPGNPGVGRNDSVAVEYDKSNPSFARIKNFRMAPFNGEFVFIFLVFPLVGMVLLTWAAVKGKKTIGLVRNGYVTTGKVTAKEPTNSRINKRRVYKVFFEYKTTDGVMRTGMVRTHQPERLGDDENELLLFDPEQPGNAVLVDSLPKPVKRIFEGQ